MYDLTNDLTKEEREIIDSIPRNKKNIPFISISLDYDCMLILAKEEIKAKKTGKKFYRSEYIRDLIKKNQSN